MPAMMPVLWVPPGPRLVVPVVSNYASCQRDIRQRASTFYLCCSLYTLGWVTLTNALLGFSISSAVLDGYEWVDGNDRVMPR